MKIVALLALFVAAVPSDVPPSKRPLVMQGGDVLMGRVERSDDATLTFSFQRAGAPVTVDLERSQVAPHSWYSIRSAAVGDDAAARLGLARFAVDHGLYAAAERELDRALEIDPSLSEEVERERVRSRDGAAQALLALARTAEGDGDLDRAWRLVGSVLTRFRGSPHEVEAVALVDSLRRARAVAEERARTEAAAAAEREEAEARERALAQARRHLDQAEDRMVAGLKNDALNAAVASFHDSIRHYRNALRELDRLAEEHGNDTAMLDRLSSLRQDATRGMIRDHDHIGSLYLVRGSYVTALEHANHALAVDPNDSSAQAFRARVEIAAAEANSGRGRRWR